MCIIKGDTDKHTCKHGQYKQARIHAMDMHEGIQTDTCIHVVTISVYKYTCMHAQHTEGNTNGHTTCMKIWKFIYPKPRRNHVRELDICKKTKQTHIIGRLLIHLRPDSLSSLLWPSSSCSCRELVLFSFLLSPQAVLHEWK